MPSDGPFDFSLPYDPATPPSFTLDPLLLEVPYQAGHSRSSSQSSVHSSASSSSESCGSVSTRRTKPYRTPIRTFGPLLLPKIRTQDQAFGPAVGPTSPAKRIKAMRAPAIVNILEAPKPAKRANTYRSSHTRSCTNPETLACVETGLLAEGNNSSNNNSASWMCVPFNYVPAPSPTPTKDFSDMQIRRASYCSLDNDDYIITCPPPYQTIHSTLGPSQVSSRDETPTPAPQSHQEQPMQAQAAHALLTDPFMYQPYVPHAMSPQVMPMLVPPVSTTLKYLTSPNPASSLVRTISIPLRDPNTKHFWWDVRQVRSWTSFNASAILSLPGAASFLSCPVPEALLPEPVKSFQRQPETEGMLHSIYANYYLPKLNAALALSSERPMQLSVPTKTTTTTTHAAAAPHAGYATDCMFVAHAAGDSASAANSRLFGGKPFARVVGLVKSFDRFNTGMRAAGNIKRIEYLRGLAHLHHAMREHGCRYGFLLTEIELVIVRNDVETVPNFGNLDVTSVQLAATAEGDMTACLALWGLLTVAGADDPSVAAPGHAHWYADVGAPAEGKRRKALPRDKDMIMPQLAEKREAKRTRGWVWPEDPVGRKELGKRGVRYGRC